MQMGSGCWGGGQVQGRGLTLPSLDTHPLPAVPVQMSNDDICPGFLLMTRETTVQSRKQNILHSLIQKTATFLLEK